MTKEQILQALPDLPRLDRDDVLRVIVEINAKVDYQISDEQKNELSQRLSDIKEKKVDLIDGTSVLNRLAKKYGI